MKTNEETAALIAEARKWANGHPNRRSGELMRDLADALESRQPSENDREATEAEIDKAARTLHMARCCSLSGDSPHDFPEASELFAAGVVLNAVPRAAVPDAATEELDKVTLDRLQELASRIEDRDYWYGIADKAKSQRDAANEDRKQAEAEIRDLLKVDIPSLKAERDAALAVIERVRAEADAYAEQPDVMEPCGAVAQALRTALDGAPEPEVKP